jgi:hypothetical protein
LQRLEESYARKLKPAKRGRRPRSELSALSP